jgi:ATP-dependent Clp protease ATP-binding subunit ClpC
MRTLTPRVQNIMRIADERAAAFGHDYVGTEHLLLAMIQDGDGIATQVIREFTEPSDVRARLEHIIASESYNAPGPPVPEEPEG